MDSIILQNNAYNRQYFILLMLENQRKKLRWAWRCFITRRTKKYFLDKHQVSQVKSAQLFRIPIVLFVDKSITGNSPANMFGSKRESISRLTKRDEERTRRCNRGRTSQCHCPVVLGWEGVISRTIREPEDLPVIASRSLRW